MAVVTNDSVWLDAIVWVRQEMARRVRMPEHRSLHRSFVANDVLVEAEAKFRLGTHGVEGWSSECGASGVQYLNTGNLYDRTIYIRSDRYAHRCSLGSIAGLVGG